MTAGVLFTDLARDVLLDYLQTNLPGQIAAVNGDRPAKHSLSGVASWTATPLRAQPETPAVGILPQTSGIRGTSQRYALDEQHVLHIYVQVGDQDEATAMDDLSGYAAAMVRTARLWMKGLAQIGASIEGGAQLEFGEGSEAHNIPVIIYGPSQIVDGSMFYWDFLMPVTITLSEAP